MGNDNSKDSKALYGNRREKRALISGPAVLFSAAGTPL